MRRTPVCVFTVFAKFAPLLLGDSTKVHQQTTCLIKRNLSKEFNLKKKGKKVFRNTRKKKNKKPIDFRVRITEL